MATFSRSNINEQTLQVTDPNRSSFDLSHRVHFTPKLGVLHPVNCEPLLPSDKVSGSLKSHLELEKVVTPAIGRTRLDTHNFVVYARRINKDFKEFVENTSRSYTSGSQDSLPFFSYDPIIASTENILFPQSQPNFIDVLNDINIPLSFHFSTDHKTVDIAPLYRWMQAILNRSITEIDYVLDPNNGFDFPYFTEDFYVMIRNRNEEYLKTISQQSVLSPFPVGYPDPVVFGISRSSFVSIVKIWMDFLSWLFEPFFGAGSTLDMLGYPIFTSSSFVATPSVWLDDFIKKQTTADFITGSVQGAFEINEDYLKPTLSGIFGMSFTNPEGSPFDNLKESLLYLFTTGFSSSIDTAKPYAYSLLGPTPLGSDGRFITPSYSEMPIRALYACWYDYMRDWHIFPRESILDPDSFGKQSLFELGIVSSEFLFILLLSDRYRTYSRDFLTSVKKDDPFMHVYAPIFSNNSVSAFTDAKSTGKSAGDIIATQIDTLLAGNSTLPFPSDDPFFSGSTKTLQVFKQDLQVMRRAGMLEKWLARNYYFPDTYVGQLQARFGVRPGDFEFLASQYIGGTEEMIAGEQVVNSTATEQMPAGQRTLVSSVNSFDSFSFRVSDYAYLVSFVSIVPMVSYDYANPHILERVGFDLPAPDFSTDARVEFYPHHYLRGMSASQPIGYVPRYYSYRIHGDETHGRYLTDLRSYNWFRDWYNMHVSDSLSGASRFQLDPYSLRVHLPLDAFLGLNPWDSIAFGNVEIECFIDRPLSSAIEIF